MARPSDVEQEPRERRPAKPAARTKAPAIFRIPNCCGLLQIFGIIKPPVGYIALWNERKFYASLFCRPSLLALSTLIHLSLYIGIVASLVIFLLGIIKGNDYFQMIAVTMCIWFVLSILKGGWLWCTRHHFPIFQYCLCAVGNGVIWTFVTTPARLTGFVEAVAHIIISSNRLVSKHPECVKEYSWLSVGQNTIQVL